MMQREVADRVASPPGRRDFGLLSATAQMHAQTDLLFTLGPESFSPPPEVDSAVVRLRFHPRFAELAVDPRCLRPLPPPGLRPEAQDPGEESPQRRLLPRPDRHRLAPRPRSAGPRRSHFSRGSRAPSPRSSALGDSPRSRHQTVVAATSLKVVNHLTRSHVVGGEAE